MTIVEDPHAATISVADHPAPCADTPIRCEQIVHAGTGERPLWVTYDPAVTEAIAHLWSPTKSARYMLGAAGYRFCRTLATGELWARPTSPETSAT